MQKKYPIAWLLLFTLSANAQTQKIFTAADYDRAAAMLVPNAAKYIDNQIQPQWLPDGRLWYRVLTANASKYVLYNPADGKKSTANSKKELLEGVAVAPAPPKLSPIETLSPDGKKTVFIRNWNLWMKDLNTGKETALTTDGVKDFGYATDNAGWKHSDKAIVRWSPDSKKIATYRQDQRHTKNMYLVKTTVGAPELEEWKYPLPTDSAVIKIHRVIIEVTESPKVIRLALPADDRRSTLGDDISHNGELDDVSWSDDGKQLAFVSTTRDHKQATLRIANAETGAVRTVFEEKVNTQYESGQGTINWKFLSKTNEIIWYSERSDWGHLYLYDATTGQVKNQITAGNFVVTRMLKTDAAKRVIYFEAKGREVGQNPYYSYVYRVDFSGKNLALLTPNAGHHAISFSPDGTYFTDTYSQPTVPPVTEVRDLKGALITTLEKTDITRLKAMGWTPPTPFSVKSADNKWDLYGQLFTPSNLNPAEKYPVIVYIYPGPQGGSVGSWSFLGATRDNQALAELGFVVVALEGSCNPNRSKSFHDACYGNMGENTLPDQIAGLRQLAEKYPYLNLNSVGIWGHSGGGFATAAAMFNYPDFFKVGISESGNHENRNYEDDWGERYIGLETKGEMGVSNYEQQANQVHAKNLKGKLLLVHGGMDDNVPPYNSYLVADALIKANKDFDFLIFPNARHGYGENTYYMMRKRWDYFVQHLMQATPPKEYQLNITPDSRAKEPNDK
ncbi:S9 family peptidase [Runella slithyformis]|uniref:Peptidase S9B dipeptidylpeptidase IV domain protein n=1 Tax=Runella slithyformis (strain ATCC 29530 / DSM 19594 / LMG 11500 / NCIMB 11436 / LSU 4) TaxID=761193 RepID=A0A7U3ZL57_RUNSL|nr:S9 family peptidase [Runella slithyformis]AEI49177.1 peptidase S9B dipeptidylpeptidase IV domain protein [Runella slithyformis DSM 19594]